MPSARILRVARHGNENKGSQLQLWVLPAASSALSGGGGGGVGTPSGKLSSVSGAAGGGSGSSFAASLSSFSSSTRSARLPTATGPPPTSFKLRLESVDEAASLAAKLDLIKVWSGRSIVWLVRRSIAS